MNADDPSFPQTIPRRSIYARLILVPTLCFIAALATDIVYTQNADMMWTNFSAWLLAIGLATAGLATLALLIDWFRNRRLPGHRAPWLQLIGNLVVLVLGLFDNLIHTRDAWTSVVPTGLTLSALTVVAILVTVALGSPRRSAPGFAAVNQLGVVR
jgi:uncharacterized membrane protein